MCPHNNDKTVHKNSSNHKKRKACQNSDSELTVKPKKRKSADDMHDIDSSSGNSVHQLKFNQKDYSCKYCDAKFKGQWYLKQHMRNSSGKTLKCEKCPAKFCHEINIGRHMNMEHNNKVYQTKISKKLNVDHSAPKNVQKVNLVNESSNFDENMTFDKVHKSAEKRKIYNVLPRPKKGQWIVRLKILQM